MVGTVILKLVGTVILKLVGTVILKLVGTRDNLEIVKMADRFWKSMPAALKRPTLVQTLEGPGLHPSGREDGSDVERHPAIRGAR